MSPITDSKGTLHHHGRLHTLRFERWLAHPQEKVWRALTEPGEVERWFPAAIHGRREQGARLAFVFPGRTLTPEQAKYLEGEAVEDKMTGAMTVYDPPRVLELTWAGEIMRCELSSHEGHTLLVFTHTFEDESKAARDASGWDVCLDALERGLGGVEPNPVTPERIDGLFADYAQRFGPKASAQREPPEI
jgi:uncharacterized protein YndB with AHSA1/START domain